MSQAGQDKIYQMVTDNVVNAIEDAIKNGGNLPWQKPWQTLQPQNMITRKAYRGINVWLLSFLPYKSPFYLTAKQVQKKGGNIRKGEKGHIVVFWKWIKITDKDTGEEKKIPFLRYYKVWNTEQCEGITAPEIQKIDFNPIDKAEEIIDNMPNPPTLIRENRAVYYPSWDKVGMPDRECFKSEGEYYSTYFHEIGHSTGHSSRLNRDEVMDLTFFGSHAYSREELVAEMTATFLCAIAGIENTFDNSVAYLKGWLTKIKSDPKLIIKAGGQAQKACDYILNKQYKATEDDDQPNGNEVNQKVEMVA